MPVFVAYSTSLGATQQSLQVTATDKAGNVTTIEHKFVVLGTLSLFGAGEAQTTEAAGTTIKSLDGTDGHTAGLDAVQAAGMGNPSSADTLLASTADKATSAMGATGITTSQTITLKTHDLLDAGSPKVEGAPAVGHAGSAWHQCGGYRQRIRHRHRHRRIQHLARHIAGPAGEHPAVAGGAAGADAALSIPPRRTGRRDGPFARHL